MPTQCMNPQLLKQTLGDGFKLTYMYMVTPNFPDKSPKLIFRIPLATASWNTPAMYHDSLTTPTLTKLPE
jgi:hypothetical protein